MSTDARINASRQNGKLGGPKSDRGLARAAANSTKFGFYAKKPPVLAAEDQRLYEEYRASIFACHQPKNKQEEVIVQQLVNTLWRIDRYETAQEYFIDNEVMNQAKDIASNNPEGIEGDLRISLALHHIISAEHSAFRELQRIIARYHRTQQRLLKQLKDLQGQRFNNPESKPVPEPAPVENEENMENEPRSAEESTVPPIQYIPVLCRANTVEPAPDRNASPPRPAKAMAA